MRLLHPGELVSYSHAGPPPGPRLRAAFIWKEQTHGHEKPEGHCRKRSRAIIHTHSGALDNGIGKPLQKRGRGSHVMGGWSGEGRHWDQGITTLSVDRDASAYRLINLRLNADGGICYNFKKVYVGFFVCGFLCLFVCFV